ncbi:MAG: DegT/DnrJ/EryC1/StrS family aminotransferase [Acidimicrobiales bacterium]
MLLDVFDSGWIAFGPGRTSMPKWSSPNGSGTAGMQPRLSSGTAALHLGLQLVGVQPGDEVLVSDLTLG